MPACVFSQVTEQRTSERSSFDPRNKEGWEGEGKRRQGGRGVRQCGRETDGCRVEEKKSERDRPGVRRGSKGEGGDQAS